jgi:hypothetical protein
MKNDFIAAIVDCAANKNPLDEDGEGKVRRY